MRQALLIVLLLALPSIRQPAFAATCTWQASAPANWNDPSQWLNCAGGNGVVAGTPGPADSALLPTGTAPALLTSNVSISALQMQAGSEIGASGPLANRVLTVSSQATLQSARLVTATGADAPTMTLQIPPSATLHLAGNSLVDRAHIDQQGTAVWLGGPDGRLRLANSGDYLNTGTTQVQSDFVLEFMSSNTALTNHGTVLLTPTASLQLQRTASSGGNFNGNGVLDLDQASFNSGPLALSLPQLILRDGTYIGPSNGITITNLLQGFGSITGRLVLGSGSRLDINPMNGNAFATLSISGSMLANANSQFEFDVAGNAAELRDQLLISGSFQSSDLIIVPRLQQGFAPLIDDSVLAIDYGSRISGSSVLRIDSAYALDWWAELSTNEMTLRIVPRLTLADVQRSEGQSGSSLLRFVASLSAPSSRPVGFAYRSIEGTANATLTPIDYTAVNANAQLAPGQTSVAIDVNVQGDILAEGDEAFALEISQNTISNASFGNGQIFGYRAEGVIRDDDQPRQSSVVLVGKDVSTNVNGGSSYLARYARDGSLIDRWRTLTSVGSGHAVTGMCQANNGDVLVTRFATSLGPLRYTANGAPRNLLNTPNIGNDESCIANPDGSFWIGEASLPNTNPSVFSLRQLAGDGRALQTLDLPVGPRGTDWIARAQDGCTLHYTSEGNKVMRYDLCTQSLLPDFVTGLEAPCFGLVQRHNGEWLLACRHRIYRFDSNGQTLQTYARADFGEEDSAGLFALALDPDGTSFWVGGAASGRVYHLQLDGTVITSFATAPGGVSGLWVVSNPDLFADGFELP